MPAIFIKFKIRSIQLFGQVILHLNTALFQVMLIIIKKPVLIYQEHMIRSTIRILAFNILEKGLKKLQSLPDTTVDLDNFLINLADGYYKLQDYKKAFDYYAEYVVFSKGRNYQSFHSHSKP